MDWLPIRQHPWLAFFLDPSVHGGGRATATSPFPENHVQWTETPDSHLFSAHLPGTRKEEIGVEVEDSRYLIIRTEQDDGGEGAGGRRSVGRFMRKFRLPGLVNLDSISAEFLDDILVVAVPRSTLAGRQQVLRLEPEDLPPDSHNHHHVVARAA